MDGAGVVRMARERAGLSLRRLGRLAGTSHSTLAAYEAGDKTPSVATLIRIVRAAGFALDLELSPVAFVPDRAARGRELVEVLDLADRFPARHEPWRGQPRFGSTQ